jgi:hypothetical protein
VLPACACPHAERKDFFYHIRLVDEADDPHLSLTPDAGKALFKIPAGQILINHLPDDVS